MKTHHLISHTHWDREWYEPFEVFRLRLVRLMDNLLELVEKDKNYIFHLDAQTIALEDYLEIRPRNRRRLERAVRRGAILVGPWHVQNDFYQVAGESTIRNLLTGVALARAFGSPGRWPGYAPDQFGLPAQLPQLLNGFGIDTLVFGRGRVCDAARGDRAEFRWEGPDGSSVLAVQMVDFYNNAQRFPSDPDPAFAYFTRQRDKLAPRLATDQFLFMNGVDHLEAQEDLSAVVRQLRTRLPRDEKIRQSTLTAYLDAVKARLKNPRVERGELRAGGDRLLCQGTLSSRIHLKTENARQERSLFAGFEPLAALADWHGQGEAASDRDHLRYLIKLLLQNQPHDSICGCSQDAVHRHMEDRSERFREAIGHLTREKLAWLGRHIGFAAGPDAYYLLVVNPLPFRRTAFIRATIDVEPSARARTLTLHDPRGQPVEMAVLGRERAERALRSPVNLPGRKLVDRYTVAFAADLPPLGHVAYTARAAPAARRAPAAPLNGENEHLRVSVDSGGRVDLTDKAAGVTRRDVLRLLDYGDLGDSYSWKRPSDALPVSGAGPRPRVRRLSDNAAETVWELRFRLRLPAAADRARQRRTARTVPVPVRIELALRRGLPYLDARIEADNRAKDHCLCAVVRTGVDSPWTECGAVFDVARRDKRADDPRAPRFDFEEPAQDFVRIGNGPAEAFSVLLDGLFAYENRREAAGELSFPLVRANGYIMGFYETPLEPAWIAPENQCQRRVTARFALCPGRSLAETIRLAQEYTAPALAYDDSVDPLKFSGGRPAVQDSDVSVVFRRADPHANVILPESDSRLAVEGTGLQAAALKPAEDGRGHVLRLANPTARRVEATVRPAFVCGEAEILRLDETFLRKAPMRDGAIRLSLPRGRVATIRLRSAKG